MGCQGGNRNARILVRQAYRRTARRGRCSHDMNTPNVRCVSNARTAHRQIWPRSKAVSGASRAGSSRIAMGGDMSMAEKPLKRWCDRCGTIDDDSSRWIVVTVAGDRPEPFCSHACLALSQIDYLRHNDLAVHVAESQERLERSRRYRASKNLTGRDSYQPIGDC